MSSPLSTGGAGTIFEYRVAAVVLAALLRGDRVEGLTVPVTGVRLQQSHFGYTLDDLVVRASSPGGEPLVLEFQVKRTIQPSLHDDEWRSFVRQCLQAVEGDRDGLTQGRHQLGLAAAAPLSQLTKLRELTKWAFGAADLASFLNDVSSPGRIDQQVRSRWMHLRDTVADIHAEGSVTSPAAEVDELAFLVAASMRVWIVEVEDEGRDFRHCLDRLADVVPPGSPVDAPYSLYLHLADVAQTRGPRSGGLTAAELRAELERRQVPAPIRSTPAAISASRYTAGIDTWSYRQGTG